MSQDYMNSALCAGAATTLPASRSPRSRRAASGGLAFD